MRLVSKHCRDELWQGSCERRLGAAIEEPTHGGAEEIIHWPTYQKPSPLAIARGTPRGNYNGAGDGKQKQKRRRRNGNRRSRSLTLSTGFGAKKIESRVTLGEETFKANYNPSRRHDGTRYFVDFHSVVEDKLGPGCRLDIV